MEVAVIGAGIVGVTTAYELAQQGHMVTIFERRGSVAEEASFAHAGVIAPSCVTSWATPGATSKLLRQLGFGSDAKVRVGDADALAQMPWLWRLRRGSRPLVHAANRAAMVRLGQYSRDRLLELTRVLQLDYEQMPGYVVLLRGEHELKTAQRGLALLSELGVPHDLVDAQRCRQLEPGLHANTPLAGGIHLPQDGVGNCRHFAHLLKAETQRLGAVFRFETAVRAVVPGSRPSVITAVGQEQTFDAVVLCAGVQANALLGGIGLRLPLVPVYGYSVTAPIRHHEGHQQIGPRAALMDERFKVTISRLGQRIRVAGGAEVGGRADQLSSGPLATLYRVLDDWFPGAALTREAQQWKGARPMLPDGPPVLGASGAPGVWLNLGHGSSGWALACGSALVLADAIAGRPAPLDVTRLSVTRLR